MFDEKLRHCPVCTGNLERGFSNRNQGLSWIPAEKMKHTAFLDKDLNEAGLKQILPYKAAYNLSYHCPACKIYIVDYSNSYSRTQANELAKSV